MLTAIEGDLFHWDCLVYDAWGDLTSCGQPRTAHIDETVYVETGGERGPTIALPRCDCGARCFLKADYTVKELWHATLSVVNAEGQIWAYVLPLRYARNLRAHHMLYERGKASYAPVLELPPAGALLVDEETTHALWFGFQTVRQYLRQAGASHLLGKLPTAPLIEKGGL